MGSYIPNTRDEREMMLKTIGVPDMNALYAHVPESIRLEQLAIPGGLAEMEVEQTVTQLARKNRVFPLIFRGAGAYNHYIPAIVRSITSKETFVTAYTPYQAEISQGVLQSIFEYQTMICELTGMDVSNASVYDGATAAAEAVHMCVDKKRPKALVAANAKPQTLTTIDTYCEGSDTPVARIACRDGKIDQAALAQALDETVACVYLEWPNYYGLFEDVAAIAETVHASGAKLILGVNPIACAYAKTPAELGADIAVGEGQPLGMPLSFGGPYLGFMATKKELVRKLPGRIVGETVDSAGARAFVLTLQAREQHIRRERASSNICSNQALCAMTAAVYMAAMGPDGLHEVARQCHAKATYALSAITMVPGFQRVHTGEFFHEFVTACPIAPEELMAKLEARGILGGLPVAEGILWCVTEMNSRAQIDALVDTLREVCA